MKSWFSSSRRTFHSSNLLISGYLGTYILAINQKESIY